MGPAEVSFMSPLAAPFPMPRAFTPREKTPRTFSTSPEGKPDGIVWPISMKQGGKNMCRSAKPQTVRTPSETRASMLNSGPSMYSSTMARPLRENERAEAQASTRPFSSETRLTPRAPMLSTGFTTRGKPRVPALTGASEAAAPGLLPSSLMTAKRGWGTPAAARVSRITSLSEAARATE